MYLGACVPLVPCGALGAEDSSSYPCYGLESVGEGGDTDAVDAEPSMTAADDDPSATGGVVDTLSSMTLSDAENGHKAGTDTIEAPSVLKERRMDAARDFQALCDHAVDEGAKTRYALDSDALAAHLDAHDELSYLRESFHIPFIKHTGSRKTYLCGNSLGLMPKRTHRRLQSHLQAWAEMGVDAHFEGSEPWSEIEDRASRVSLRLVGARAAHEVVYMNSLTVNLHLLMVAFYRPTSARYKILVEAGSFPSDRYAVRSQLRFHGLTAEHALVELHPRKGECHLRDEDILGAIDEHRHCLALVMLSGVHYYTGQLLPMRDIAAAAHRHAIPIGFDLAHAVGNVELRLHDWQVDFAVWCTYKYLNAGPGATSGVFVHDRHADDRSRARFTGWWGSERDSRFLMRHEFVPQRGAGGFQLSNPSVLSMVSVASALELFDEVGMSPLVRKSTRLTGYLAALLDALLREEIDIITPRQPACRGCQLSLRLRYVSAEEVQERLQMDGVVCDTRKPDVLRVAPVPMYNTYGDVLTFVRSLRRAISDAQKGVSSDEDKQ